ncbi:hypothetical protein [Vibrio phage BONAISHI]|nr:hypothetical protein [Vibrio phage BONAISHI]
MNGLDLDLNSVSDTDSAHSASTWVIQNTQTRRQIKNLKMRFDASKVYSKEFLKAILNYKLVFLKKIYILAVEGCNQFTLENLIMVLHDLDIDPRRLFLNGSELNA